MIGSDGKMSRGQAIVALSWIALIFASGIWVPWRGRYTTATYGLLFLPPRNIGWVLVDTTRLAIEWTLITVACAGAYLLTKQR